MLNANHIHCFLELAKENNFTRAAENLYMNQPNLSRTIAALEKELGTRLFIRHSDKTIELSEQGALYYEFFHRSAAEFQQLQAQCKAIDDQELEIRIGYISEWDMSDYLGDRIVRFSKVHPTIQITLVPALLDELEPMLRSRTIDACITLRPSIAPDSKLAIKTICHLPKAIIYKTSLLGKESKDVTMLDFHDTPFYLYPESMLPSTLRYLQRHLAPFKPIVRTTQSVEKVISEIEYGKGVAIMDAWCRVSFSRKLSAYPLPDTHNVAFIYRKEADCAPLDAIRKAFTDL